ncbi:unnamed protein product [Effrenium voratum]|nr:unnamed protein product [Effrenium voratum]CAJ1437816.1 unnamed protein product [Effrenium voratum]
MARFGHQWRRKQVVLPREQILGNVQLSDRLAKLAREQVQSREKEAEEPIECSSPRFPDPKNAVAKFLTSACLPSGYAAAWRRMTESPRTPVPPTLPPTPDWEGACCIVESAGSLVLHLSEEKTEKVPPRTWLLLEPGEERSEPKELQHFVTKNNTCLLANSAGGGWLQVQNQPGISLLRAVPEKRLHGPAAEANFGRAASGQSVVALRHAALALELLKNRTPPFDGLTRRVRYAFPPQPVKESVLPLVPLKGLPQRPLSPQQPPPWPQFLTPEEASEPRWAEPSSPSSPSSARPSSRARPDTGDSTTARSARLEALVTSRASASERCAESARAWRESCYENIVEEDEEKRLPQAQSVMQKGFHALMEFLDFTNRRYGNPARTWFILDSEANMKLGMRQFERRCMDIGFRGNIPALWKYMDKRNTGVVSLLDLHSVTAMELARFKLLIRERFRDASAEAFRFLDDNRSGRVNRVTFAARLQTLRYAGKASKLFDYLDRQGLGILTVHSLTFLDRWMLPPYMYYQPDVRGVRVVKEKLLDLHQHALIAWRKIDKDGSMRISYDEFRGYIFDMLSGNKAQVQTTANFPRSDAEIAAVWRAMDKDCTGYIQLRDWDSKSHLSLSEFKTWAERTHGTVTAAFRALDVGGNGVTSNCKLSLTELKKCTKGPDGCKAEVEFLFDGLDVNHAWSLSEADVKFLDFWDLSWEEWQEGAKKRRSSSE